jgi:TRAP-type C4-dicarboxylate transport system substrate-binding protein
LWRIPRLRQQHRGPHTRRCEEPEIRTYEDELVNTFWGKIGTASIIPGSEIYSALQTKTVDAMEFHASGVVNFKLYEVTSYFSR